MTSGLLPPDFGSRPWDYLIWSFSAWQEVRNWPTWASTTDKCVKTGRNYEDCYRWLKKKSTSCSARHHRLFFPLLRFARFSESSRSERHQSLHFLGFCCVQVIKLKVCGSRSYYALAHYAFQSRRFLLESFTVKIWFAFFTRYLSLLLEDKHVRIPLCINKTVGLTVFLARLEML